MADFEEFWKLHGKWGAKTPIIREVKELSTVTAYLSDIPSEYFNFAVPKVESPNDLDLEEIRKIGVYLHEKHWHNGFVEYLIRNGYKFSGTNCWLVSDPASSVDLQTSAKITEVASQNFSDFYKVLSVVFKDFPGNEKYLEICRDSLTKNIGANDLLSKFFLIYENDQPVSGAGVFYSKIENFAYFHNAGTLESSRGKGYQTSLIKHRLKLVKDLEINRIYTITELGSKSWQNYLKLGFDQKQVAIVMTPK